MLTFKMWFCNVPFKFGHIAPYEIAVYCTLWGSNSGMCLSELIFFLWILSILLILNQYHVLEDNSASVFT